MAIRRALRRLAGGALILSAAAACSDQALAPKPRDVPQPAYAPLSRLRTPSSRYLVSFRSAEPGTFATRIRGFGGRVERRFGDMNLAVVKDIGAIGAAALAADPAVEAVVPDLRLQFIPRPNGGNHPLGVATSRTPGTDQSGTFFFPIQYNIRQVRADQAWSRSTGGRNALVPWIWTGVALNVTSALVIHLPQSRTRRPLLLLACVAAFSGVWIEKGMGLIIPGFVPSTLHEIVEYSPSLTEWKVSAGVYAGGLMALIILLKIVLPVFSGQLSVSRASSTTSVPPSL